MTIAREVDDYYSEGLRLDDRKTWNVIAKKLRRKALPTDEAGIYAVLSDKRVRQVRSRKCVRVDVSVFSPQCVCFPCLCMHVSDGACVCICMSFGHKKCGCACVFVFYVACL